jgi:riboflavin synthase
MFTGIVEEVGRVKAAGPNRLTISAARVMDDLKVDDSISINGTCLTVTARDEGSFSADVVPETLRRTNLGSLKAGDPVNLERSMPASGRFGGHIVQGHVDGTGTVTSIEPEGNALLMRFQASPPVMRYVVEKGFITVDGTSLTVVNCDHDSFMIAIIPHTRENTVFGSRRVGDSVNLEVDIIAKYVERLSVGSRVPLDIADEL